MRTALTALIASLVLGVAPASIAPAAHAADPQVENRPCVSNPEWRQMTGRETRADLEALIGGSGKRRSIDGRDEVREYKLCNYGVMRGGLIVFYRLTARDVWVARGMVRITVTPDDKTGA